MTLVHLILGWSVVGLFTVGWVWGGLAMLRRRPPAERFWTWLSAVQVVAVLQAVIGLALLAIGRMMDDWLHLVYGLGPLVIVGVAHLLARDTNFRERPWVPFTLASFICFGLSLRALMTGLGVG